MKISERKQKILKSLIDNYITTCEPISSSHIKEVCLPEVSSATIRSEMVALEEMGYLVQPHKSAGRIPSSKAYRYYVDNLIDKNDIENQIDKFKNYFDNNFKDVEQIIKNTAKVISDVTNYTSIMVMGGVDNIQLKDIKLIDIGNDSALIVIITDSGVLKDKIIDVPKDMNGRSFISANDMLTDMFVGKTVKEITDKSSEIVEQTLEEYKDLFKEVLDMLKNYKTTRENKMFLEGTDKIFEYKEFEDVGNVKNFLSVINTQDKLHELIGQDDDIEISIKIGKDENAEDNMAIVTAKCIIAGEEIGHAVVIGPERMDYQKVLGVLGGVTKAIENIKKE